MLPPPPPSSLVRWPSSGLAAAAAAAAVAAAAPPPSLHPHRLFPHALSPRLFFPPAGPTCLYEYAIGCNATACVCRTDVARAYGSYSSNNTFYDATAFCKPLAEFNYSSLGLMQAALNELS